MELDERHEYLIYMLEDLIRIIDSNNLKYILLGGSVLGAVRHSDIIPWDDDIDIGLTRSEFKQLEELLSKNNLSKYIFEKSDDHIIPDAPIAKLRYNIDNIPISKLPTIDIFALDQAPNSDKDQNSQIFWGNIYNFCIYRQPPKNRGKLIERTSKVFLTIIPNKIFEMIRKESYKKLTKWDNQDTPYITNLYGYPHKKELFHKEVYLNTVKKEFNRLNCNIPKDYDKYLKQMYGDYMALPPINERKPKHL